MVKRLQVVQGIVAAARLQQRLALPMAITPPPAVTPAITPPVRMDAHTAPAVVQADAWRVSAPTIRSTRRAP